MRKLPELDGASETYNLTRYYDELEIWRTEVPKSALGYSYSYRSRFEESIDMVRRAKSAPARVLDVAGASGNLTLTLAEVGYSVTWNDLREEFVDIIKRKHQHGSVDFLPGNVFDLSVPEESQFDVVVANEVIEHVAHPEALLAMLSKLINADGRIVVTTPCGEYFRNRLPRFSDIPDPDVLECRQFQPDSGGHLFLLHIDELHAVAELSELEVQKLRLFTNPLTAGHVKLGYVLPFMPSGIVSSLEHLGRHLPMWVRPKIHSGMGAILRRRR